MALNERGEMPKETFYPINPDHEGTDERLQVDWHRTDLSNVYVTVVYNRPDGVVVPVCVDLDRPGLNRLIKTLRRARDQTFGADE